MRSSSGHMKSTFLALTAGTLVLGAGTVSGQIAPSAAIQQAETFQRNQEAARPRFRVNVVPNLYEGEQADVGPQYVVVPKQKPQWIELSLDSQLMYTSNVFLTEKGTVDSTLAVHTLLAGIAPTPWDVPGGKLQVRAGYRHQFFQYGLLTSHPELVNNIDFDVSTVYTQARYQFLANWVATVGVDYNRLLSPDQDRGEFYVEVLPNWALERAIQINQDSLLTLGYSGNYHFTRADQEPKDINNRTDHTLSLIYSYKLWDKLVLQPYYRLMYTRYEENQLQTGPRQEWLNSAGLSLTYYFTEWASIRTFINYDKRTSDDPTVQDYHKWDTGGGVSVYLRF